MWTDDRDHREKPAGTRLRLPDAADVHPVPGRLGGPGSVFPAARPLLRRQGKRRLPGQRGPPRAYRLDAAVPARGRRTGRLRHVVPRRRRLAGRHAQGAEEQARLPSAARHHRPVGQPALPAGRVRAELPRLRHPELPRRRSAFRDARGVPRLRPGRPRAGDLRHPRHHRPSHRQRLHLRPGPLPDARPGFGPVVQRPALGRQALRRPGLQRPRRPADAALRPARSRARLEAAWPDGAIWPREFQRPDLFLRKGHITNWDYYPEYAEGDMFGSEDPRHLGAVGRAVPPGFLGPGLPGPRLLLLDRLRRPRRLPHRRRQAHGRGGAAVVL